MKKLKLILLSLVVVSQVFFVKYVILPSFNRHASQYHHSNPPPEYVILTDGKFWTWEHDASGFTGHSYRDIQDYWTKQEAIDSAWFQYEFELHEATNKWKAVR